MGAKVGCTVVGLNVGFFEGNNVGVAVGIILGNPVGNFVGIFVSWVVGFGDGKRVGAMEGLDVFGDVEGE